MPPKDISLLIWVSAFIRTVRKLPTSSVSFWDKLLAKFGDWSNIIIDGSACFDAIKLWSIHVWPILTNSTRLLLLKREVIFSRLCDDTWLRLASPLPFTSFDIIRNLGRHRIKVYRSYNFFPIFILLHVTLTTWSSLSRALLVFIERLITYGERLSVQKIVHWSRISIADWMLMMISFVLFLYSELNLLHVLRGANLKV